MMQSYIAATCRITVNVAATNADKHRAIVSVTQPHVISSLAPADFLRWRTTPDKVGSTHPPRPPPKLHPSLNLHRSCIPEKKKSIKIVQKNTVCLHVKPGNRVGFQVHVNRVFTYVNT